MLAQHDGAIGAPVARVRLASLLRIGERHTLALPRPFDPATDTVTVGLYDPTSSQRLPLTGGDGATPGDAFVLPPGE
jgi:hypothetical protein